MNLSVNLPDFLMRSLYPERRHHALLFCQLSKVSQLVFLKQVAQIILCQNQDKVPCGHCQSCHLVSLDQHPDLMLIQPDKPGGAIKVDQVRTMLSTVYLSPKLSTQRVVIISPAEQLNQATGNALLKVLEEPPPGVYFILSTDKPDLLLPTIVSRCQIWHMNHEDAWMRSCGAYVAQGMGLTSEKHLILEAYQSITDDLHHVITKKSSICLIASKWQKFELKSIMHLLYCIISQLIRDQMNREHVDQTIVRLHALVPFSVLFQALDYLHAGFQKINHNIHMNTLLVIENFLMILMKEGHDESGR